MRIVAGKYRGRALTPLGRGDAGAHLRPTTDRIRESLFNILGHRFDFEGARVLDLFAGTGALGLEALSRGASEVAFVDDGRIAGGLIQKNIDLLGVRGEACLIRANAARLRENAGAPYDLVFLDPPYGKNLGEKAIASALRHGWIAAGALIVWEEGQEVAVPDGFEAEDQRKFGQTQVLIMRRRDNS